MTILLAAAVSPAAASGDGSKASAPIGQPRLRATHEEFLREVLAGFTRSDPAERREAFDRMSRAGETAAPFLQDALRTASDPLLRRGVLLTLGEIGGSDSVALVRDAVENDRWQDEERTVAVLVLGRLGDTRSVPSIARIAIDQRPSMLRRAAILASGRLGDADCVGRLVVRLSKEPLVEDRVATLIAAAAVADRVWLPAIVSHLDDRAADVRRAAAVAIGRIADAAALPGILSALRVERDGSVAATMVVALGAFDDPASRDALAARLDAKDDAVRTAVFAALAARTDGAVELERWFTSSHPSEQRAIVATALADAAAWGPLRAVLEPMLGDPSADVRSAAGSTLATYGGDASAQPILDWLAQERDADALAAAVVAVGVLGLDGARERLGRLAGPKPLVEDACRTLEGRRDRRHLVDRLEQRIAERGARLRDRVRLACHGLVEVALDLDSISRRGPPISGATEVGEPGGPDGGPGGPMPEGFGHRRPLRIDSRNLAVERDLKLWFDRVPYFEPWP